MQSIRSDRDNVHDCLGLAQPFGLFANILLFGHGALTQGIRYCIRTRDLLDGL